MTGNKMSGSTFTHFKDYKGNILIIDGDREDRVFFRRLLQSAYSVVTAADGEAAMKNVERYADFLSLIIIDLEMEGTDGQILLEELKKDERFGRIPVVALGFYDAEGAEAMRAGACDFLKKPFDTPEMIRMRIDNAISGAVAPSAEDKGMETDSLTGLMTMPRFTDMVEAVRSGKVLTKSDQEGFIFFDLSKFKLYNILKGREAGDRMLAEVGGILREIYGKDRIVRKSDDHFVVLDYETGSVVTRVMEVSRRVANLDPDFRLQIRAGIYFASSHEPINEACDKAKLAGDSIRDNLVMPYCIYTEDLNKRAELKKYLVDNLDRAIEEGWIHIYYQPVVRTLSGELCGLEALTRWMDPERGMLPPATFIPALEESNIIYKLDTYVIREVARKLREQMDLNLPVVPVSFNISRMDFDRNDPYEVVEHITQFYKLPSELLRVEITESAVMDDEEKIHAEMNKFQQHNYEVWMDDFGSGYSSLNVLKDFYFDEIKIDMLFLNKLNDRSRQIITSIVDMAKKMGIRTLAEGVETEEQIRFLCDIGCEKLQGFYYGKPMPYAELMQHCRNIGIEPEDILTGKFYDKVGNVNVITDGPLSLVRYDGREMEFVYSNAKFREVLDSTGIRNLREAQNKLNSAMMAHSQKLHGLTIKAARTGKPEMATLVISGNYLKVISEHIGKLGNIHMFKVSVDNITIGTQTDDASRYDRLVRNVIMVYDEVYLLDLKEDYCETVISSRYEFSQGVRMNGLKKLYEDYADSFVYYVDREAFLEFGRKQRFNMNVGKNTVSHYAQTFRIRHDDGSFRWHDFIILGIPENENQLLACVKLSSVEFSEDRNRATECLINEAKTAAPVSLPSSTFWESLMDQTDMKIFWKDKEQRYLGASKSFCDYYGIDEKTLRGKTDAELGWRPGDGGCSNENDDVLRMGERVLNAPGRSIRDGNEENVLRTVLPVYENGMIEGLIGYIQDSDVLTAAADVSRMNQMIDPLTGLYNIWGINSAIAEAEENYKKNAEDYSVVMLDLPEYDSLRAEYGNDLCKDLLKRLGEELRAAASPEASLARLHGSLFMVIEQESNRREHEKKVFALMRAMRMVDTIGDNSIVLRVEHGSVFASDCRGLQHMLDTAFGKIMGASRDNLEDVVFERNNSVFTASSFENSNELVVVWDPDDYTVLYLNKRARRELGLDPNVDISGMTCYDLLHGSRAACDFCMYDRLRRDRFFIWTGYNPVTGRDYLRRNSLIPWNGKNCGLLMSTPLDDVLDSGSNIRRRIIGTQAINESVSVAMNEEKPQESLQELLRQIVNRTSAEKAYIYEEDGTGYMNLTYKIMKDDHERVKMNARRPKAGFKPLFRLFETDRVAIVVDRDRARGLLEDARIQMEDVGIRSFAAVQIVINGKSRGFIGIENYDSLSVDLTTSDMRMLGDFASTMLRNSDILEQISEMNGLDDLTGVRNRKAFSEILDDDSHDKDFSLVYVDLNDLNSINKNQGRKTGDMMLGKVADILIDMFDRKSVYRIGGDEFVAVTDFKDNEQIDEVGKLLRKRLMEEDINAALGFVRKGSDSVTVREMLREADRRLYLDKRFMQNSTYYM